jgi:hypothetical protein
MLAASTKAIVFIYLILSPFILELKYLESSASAVILMESKIGNGDVLGKIKGNSVQPRITP